MYIMDHIFELDIFCIINTNMKPLSEILPVMLQGLWITCQEWQSEEKEWVSFDHLKPDIQSNNNSW